MDVRIRDIISQSIDVKSAMLADQAMLSAIKQSVDHCILTLDRGGRVLLCGNGGSAADAQHIAAELSGRFKIDRQPLDCTALHVNSSYLTAVSNDYGYDQVFARILQARGRSGDVLIALSTSGNSSNVVNAVSLAKELGIVTIGLTGSTPGGMDAYCDVLIKVPSTDTARIQECHITIGHAICEIVEQQLAIS